jgi:xanthine dehydrogenase accessory factor
MAETRLLILGKGEIARCLARLARAADYPVSVCEPDLAAGDWPLGTELLERVYTDDPWPLPPHTHAVIARGHEDDPQSVASLLHQEAEHVYLIASAQRAQGVLQRAQAMLPSALHLERLSAPAGLGLGGRASSEIALAILAEIQWRRHGGPLLPLRELRAMKAAGAASAAGTNDCPGQRE